MRPTHHTRLNPGFLARLLAFATVAAIIAFAPSAARADSNTTYNFAGTMSNGSSFTGTLDFDTVGSVTSLVDATINLAGLTFTCDGATSNLCLVQNSGFSQYFQTLDGSALFLLSWNPINFNNPPSTFTFNGGYCMNCAAGTVLIVTSGIATVAPEPETIMLLAAGLVALLGVARRKRILGSEL
jgi:PEP-CTERM motif-containing protein